MAAGLHESNDSVAAFLPNFDTYLQLNQQLTQLSI